MLEFHDAYGDEIWFQRFLFSDRMEEFWSNLPKNLHGLETTIIECVILAYKIYDSHKIDISTIPHRKLREYIISNKYVIGYSDAIYSAQNLIEIMSILEYQSKNSWSRWRGYPEFDFDKIIKILSDIKLFYSDIGSDFEGLIERYPAPNNPASKKDREITFTACLQIRFKDEFGEPHYDLIDELTQVIFDKHDVLGDDTLKKRRKIRPTKREKTRQNPV